jgi:hypothetical protein
MKFHGAFFSVRVSRLDGFQQNFVGFQKSCGTIREERFQIRPISFCPVYDQAKIALTNNIFRKTHKEGVAESAANIFKNPCSLCRPAAMSGIFASGHGAGSAEKPKLFLPDAFDNPEYVHFAVKGSLAALICYIFFVGFDYPNAYTSLITCFVVSLTTVGASK